MSWLYPQHCTMQLTKLWMLPQGLCKRSKRRLHKVHNVIQGKETQGLLLGCEMSPHMPADCGGGERQACRMTWFITLSIVSLPYSLPANCTINNSQQSLPTTNQQFEEASQSASCSDTPRPARTTWLIYWSPHTAIIHFTIIPPTFT